MSMMTISLPYGMAYINCELPSDKVRAILEPREMEPNGRPEEVVMMALNQTFGAARMLHDMARNKRRVLIITSDQTRPVPSRITLPILLREIEAAHAEADLLIATGLHSSPSSDEMAEKYGKENLERFSNVIVHDSSEEDDQFRVGELSTGLELYANKELAKEDQLIIAEGFIEPHFFAGFTGGPKSILPGVAGAKSIMANHSPSRIEDQNSRSGILRGNPIQEEMREASSKANLRFVLNVLLDDRKRIVRAVAGETLVAHEVGCSIVSEYNKVEASPAEIVLTSNNGFPLDRNMYQMVKGLSAAALTVKSGGVIVIAGECIDGVGHEKFYEMLAESESPKELLERIRRGEIDEEDQWEAQVLAKVLEKARVIVVSGGLRKSSVEDMHMIHSNSLEEALGKAFELTGRESKVTILPRGPATIVT